MKTAAYDLIERVGWTFVQAFVGSLVATNLAGSAVDWRQVLVSAAVAGLVAVLKVLGVNVAKARSATVADVAKVAETVPALADVAKRVEASPVADVPVAEVVKEAEQIPAVTKAVETVSANPVVETSEDVARQVAEKLIDGK